MSSDAAQGLIEHDRSNADVLQPFINGEDLNRRPDQSPSRWVINFRDWPKERAAKYSDCWEIIERDVRPDRQRLKANGDYVLRRPLPDRYWQYAEKRPGLMRAIGESANILACSEVTKYLCFAWLPTGWVYSANVDVFPKPTHALFALLQSSFHDAWARKYSAHLETRLKYSPGNAFETFPQPELTSAQSVAGEALNDRRRVFMRQRGIGLTATYNLVHDPTEFDDDVAGLREVHAHIDEAVASAYGWTDLPLLHGFHTTALGTRWTVTPSVQAEILDRLLALNHARYAEEQAKASGGRQGKARSPVSGRAQDSYRTLFDNLEDA